MNTPEMSEAKPEPRGQGRPPIGDGPRERITITLDREVLRRLDNMASGGMSRSWMVEYAIRPMLGMPPIEIPKGILPDED